MATAASPLNVNDLPAEAFSSSKLYCFTVDRYLEMGQAGYFNDGPKVELLAGAVVAKMIKNAPHTAAKRNVFWEVKRRLQDGWDVLQEDPIRLALSVPEPDVTVVRGRYTDYERRHPTPPDIGLVIEVADSSLADDRGIKRVIYAEAAIVEYWIVNLVEQRIEVYTQPSGPAASPDYQSRRDYAAGDDVPLTLDNRSVGTIPVRNILPGDAP